MRQIVTFQTTSHFKGPSSHDCAPYAHSAQNFNRRFDKQRKRRRSRCYRAPISSQTSPYLTGISARSQCSYAPSSSEIPPHLARNLASDRRRSRRSQYWQVPRPSETSPHLASTPASGRRNKRRDPRSARPIFLRSLLRWNPWPIRV